MDRAQEAGVDDCGIGVLFGLYDWQFEVMGLLYHTIHLEETFNGVGPHTISFPRITPATGTPFSNNPEYAVSNNDFKSLLPSCGWLPYTGLICTAREPYDVRRINSLGVTRRCGTRIVLVAMQISMQISCLKKNNLPLVIQAL